MEKNENLACLFGENPCSKRVYISGANWHRDYMERFEKAEERLKSLGYSVVNPAKVNAQMPTDLTRDEYMEMSYTMLELCWHIYMLKGWENSDGANLEIQRAKELLLNVMYEE